jgi:hypothetical protein
MVPPRDDEVVRRVWDWVCLVCGEAEADYLVTLADGTSLLVCGACRALQAVEGAIITPLWRIDGGKC